MKPQNKSPFQVRNIIPEILRYQFFRKRSSDPNDCLLDVCKKLLQEIKKDGKSDVLRRDTRTKNKPRENENEKVIVVLGITIKYSIKRHIWYLPFLNFICNNFQDDTNNCNKGCTEKKEFEQFLRDIQQYLFVSDAKRRNSSLGIMDKNITEKEQQIDQYHKTILKLIYFKYRYRMGIK